VPDRKRRLSKLNGNRRREKTQNKKVKEKYKQTKIKRETLTKNSTLRSISEIIEDRDKNTSIEKI
jgi:hypothetical protein